VDTLAERWRPLYSYSNEPAFRRDVASALTRGDSSEVRLGVVRDGHEQELRVSLVRQDRLPDQRDVWRHDLPGPTLRLASADLAYRAFCRATNDSVEAYVARIASAKCLVIDLRNYPRQGVQHPLGAHLVSRPTLSATFSGPDYANPGAFTFGPSYWLQPVAPRFEGRVEILVDEVTESAAEFAALMLRACPNSRVVGSTTSGADGNVADVVLPGGLSTAYSSIGVYTPDRRSTQRVGIVPDLEVHPTIAGLLAGRDEVLEAAVRDGLGRELTASEREALAPRPESNAPGR
jgi:C-terminal processing protease CtpA/Prc